MTEADTVPTATRAQARGRLVRLLRARWVALVRLVVLTGLGTAAGLAGPALIGVVVDAAAGNRPARHIDLAAGTFVLLAVVAAVLRYAADVAAARIGEDALVELRGEVLEHAVDVRPDRTDLAGSAEMVARVTGDVTLLARVVRHTVTSVVFYASELLLIVVALVLVDPVLAGVALAAGAPGVALGAARFVRTAPPRYARERIAQAVLVARLLELYRGRGPVAAHGATARFRRRTAAAGRAEVDACLACNTVRNQMRPLVSAGLACALVAVVAVGAARLASGAVSVGAVSAAALYVIRMFTPVGVLLEEVDEIQQAMAALARLVGVTLMPRQDGGPAAVSGRRSSGLAVHVEDVGFAYVAGAPVLHGVQLHIPAGGRAVLVGASGAGKTTLGRLVVGDLLPSTGRVRFTDRSGAELGSARGATVLVPQEGHVFGRTVAENVRLGRPDADDATVLAALATVGAADLVAALPRGLHTVLGAAGVSLSLPQQQLIGLARLVCADPAVVVLDEATAELDPVSAARTERALDAALAGRTVVAIAHRLDAAARSDFVVVLDAGRIVAVGPHAGLVETDPVYRVLWRAWLADRGDPVGEGA